MKDRLMHHRWNYLLFLLLLSELECAATFLLTPVNIRSSFQNKPRSSNYLKHRVDENADVENGKSIQHCPFSKYFPRYRLDLTTVREKEQPWFRMTFKSVSKNNARFKFQSQLQPGENFVWASDKKGVAALSFLWNRAYQVSIDKQSTFPSELIALPDASPQMATNWVEIVEWMNQQPELSSLSEISKIHAELIIEDSMPAVRIQRIGEAHDEPESFIPESIINKRTQAWVKRILVEMGICPFTKSVHKSGQGLSDVGVPVASISYHASFATTPLRLMADTWTAILAMLEAGPSGKDGISSILLAAPAFDDNIDVWSGPIFAMLEAGVVASQSESSLGVVCFHPRYATPDGRSWPGFGHMHSVPRLERWYQESTGCPVLTTDEIAAGGAWQRRTPHATINVLRAEQLAAAESRRSTGQLYAVNIEKLVGREGIGSDKLALDLERERQIL